MKDTANFVLAVALAAAASGQIRITGAGATFPSPMYSKWFSEYRKLHKDVQILYQSLGSGAGIDQVTQGAVDLGASDAPMSDMQLKEFQNKRGSAVLHFPTVLGADVPAYKIAGVTGPLNFTPEALAGIFLGSIKKWNDPELMKANPGVSLPNADIVVVHRSDASGSTYVWTDYLSKISKEWETQVGRAEAVKWPVGLEGRGNEGVAGKIEQTPNSISYVELAFAVQNTIPYGKVKNAAGEFMQASLASVTAAATVVAKTMPEDFRVSITNARGKGVYPISSFTWLLIPEKIADPAKKKTIADFLAWMLKDGQSMTAALEYAQLPK